MAMRTIACCILVLALFGDGNAQDRGKPPDRPKRTQEAERREPVPREPVRQAGEEQGRGRSVERERGRRPERTPMSNLPGQRRDTLPRQQGVEYRPVFSAIEAGLGSGNVASLSAHFAPQVSIYLRGGESGSYSSNQAYYVLENYLRARKVLSVDFSTIGEADANPYATGTAGFSVKGGRETAQVYVSLSLLEGRWVITQINIY